MDIDRTICICIFRTGKRKILSETNFKRSFFTYLRMTYLQKKYSKIGTPVVPRWKIKYGENDTNLTMFNQTKISCKKERIKSQTN